jgi:micrococcal nuclease
VPQPGRRASGARAALAAAGALALLLVPAAAETGLATGRSAAIVAVTDGPTVRTVEGTTLRLFAIRMPAPGSRWPAVARRVLAGLVVGRDVRISPEEPRRDRHGRLLVDLMLPDGRSVQGEMVAAGLALVDPLFIEAGDAAARLLAAEQGARAAGRGLWSDGTLILQATGDVPTEGYRLVEGTILAAEAVRGRIYLNFGPDHAKDFTVVIPPERTEAFAAAGLTPGALAGRSVRVRGWVSWNGGPAIEAATPWQIERLGSVAELDAGDSAVVPCPRGRRSDLPRCSRRSSARRGASPRSGMLSSRFGTYFPCAA